jgi:hypothetical protein
LRCLRLLVRSKFFVFEHGRILNFLHGGSTWFHMARVAGPARQTQTIHAHERMHHVLTNRESARAPIDLHLRAQKHPTRHLVRNEECST